MSDNWDNLDWGEILAPLAELEDCSLCPRECHADRSSDRLGYCQTTVGYSISSIVAHHGEEPVISGENGICNVFFTRCNMQCVFCQNYQISRNHDPRTENLIELKEAITQIETLLDQGAHGVGFVSPSHFVPQMKRFLFITPTGTIGWKRLRPSKG
jgi:putative pyruvate formate lyase activating enzyme